MAELCRCRIRRRLRPKAEHPQMRARLAGLLHGGHSRYRAAGLVTHPPQKRHAITGTPLMPRLALNPLVMNGRRGWVGGAGHRRPVQRALLQPWPLSALRHGAAAWRRVRQTTPSPACAEEGLSPPRPRAAAAPPSPAAGPSSPERRCRRCRGPGGHPPRWAGRLREPRPGPPPWMSPGDFRYRSR